MRDKYGIPEKTCRVCGKLLYPTPQWIYKIVKNSKVSWYCSYRCWRKDGGDSGPTIIKYTEY